MPATRHIGFIFILLPPPLHYVLLHFARPNSALRLETCSPPEGAKGNSLLRRLWGAKAPVVASNAHLALPLYKQREG